MRRANIIQKETEGIEAVEDLTGVFEAIASTQVAKIKDKVGMAQDFFDLLWKRYSSIRIDSNRRFGGSIEGKINKTVFVIISAEAGLSGDIDQRLIETMMKSYDPVKTDIVVIGSHGAHQLHEAGIPYVKFFRVPESDTYVDVSPIMDTISAYAKITVYYEAYVSLGVQEIKTIDLFSEIKAMGQDNDADEDIITDQETIFEPSLDEIADLMERGMMNLALSQAILESNLAQSASRFNAMAAAKKLALELVIYHKLEFHRSKRSESDRRLREVLIGIKKRRRKAMGAK